MKKSLAIFISLVIIVAFFSTSKDLRVSEFKFEKVELSKDLEKLALDTLKNYLQLKTVRGDETKAANFFKSLFDEYGIENKIIKIPGKEDRSIFLATIGENHDGRKGVVLAGHSDVVEANESKWKSAPFEANIKKDMIYARGAIDMKTLSVMHFISMIALKRSKQKLNRKIMFLLVPGEEDGGLGAKYLVENKKELFKDYGYLINEGAFFSKGIPSKGIKIANIQYAEKGIFWFMAKSRGKPGHGSAPTDNYAAIKMVKFINESLAHFSKRIVIKPVQMTLHQIGKSLSGVKSFILKRSHNLLVQKLLESTFRKSKQLNAMTRNTFSITGLKSNDSLGMNVIGDHMTLKVDMRILPGQDINKIEKDIKKIANKYDIEILTVQKNLATKSELNNEFFNSMAYISESSIEGIVASPLMSYGATDNFHFRSLGLNCYGFFPVLLSSEEISAMHGDNERVSIKNVARGSQIMSTLVRYWGVESSFK